MLLSLPVGRPKSILSEVKFRAVQCSSLEDFKAGLCENNLENFMGVPADIQNQGTFYLETNAQEPYAIGK